MELFLGVDGGASKTVALLADGAGRVLGRGVAGGANVRLLGVEAAGAAISAAVAEAFTSAGLVAQPCAAACLGLAGAGRAEERALVERWLAERALAAHVAVCDDAQLVLAAGAPEGWGVALICGTGSIAVGRAPDGRTARAGGWGQLLGDEGSGREIAIAGLRAACQSADGRARETTLLPALLEQWGLARPEELIGFVYQHREPALLLAEVPPLVGKLAAAGDPAARAILEAAAGELARAVGAVATRLGLAPPLPLALAGGVLQNIAWLREALVVALERRGLAASVALVREPAAGAIRIALITKP